MPCPYPYAIINTPEIQRRECNGIYKGEEQFINIREMEEYAV